MTSEEICRILNEHKHDGGSDWAAYLDAPDPAYYRSQTLAERKWDFRFLSPASAEIIAQHYKGLEKQA